MTLADYARFSAAHTAWAIGQLLERSRGLPAARFDEDLGIGPGSLRFNLAHTIEAMFFFADNFRGRAYEERPDFAALSGSIDGLSTLLARAAGELREAVGAAAERGIPDRLPWPSSERGWMSGTAALAQAFDHATAHRAQCVNMLKRLGVPPPDLDPMSFEESNKSL